MVGLIAGTIAVVLAAVIVVAAYVFDTDDWY
jgi:hypothetical protein